MVVNVSHAPRRQHLQIYFRINDYIQVSFKLDQIYLFIYYLFLLFTIQVYLVNKSTACTIMMYTFYYIIYQVYRNKYIM